MIEFVKPVAGARVMDPRTLRPIPPDGKAVNTGGDYAYYWNRRFADGTLVRVKESGRKAK